MDGGKDLRSYRLDRHHPSIACADTPVCTDLGGHGEGVEPGVRGWGHAALRLAGLTQAAAVGRGSH